jgi:L-rhamnose mutarotase
MGMVIAIEPQHIDEYKRLHVDVWPAVLARLKRSNVTNYSIFLREPENLLFGYWEYVGTDYERDMADIAQDADTQRWWLLCGPCQRPLASRLPGEHWASMEEVFHMD